MVYMVTEKGLITGAVMVKKPKNERKKVYLSFISQTMFYGFYIKHILYTVV
jgi:hypothetical protein